jgi:hypothetical protein
MMINLDPKRISAVLIFLVSSKVLAFGSLGQLSAPVGGIVVSFGQPMSPSINLPYGVSFHPAPMNPPHSEPMPSKDVDANQVPVQDLPPLPLTLDEPEQTD